MSLPDHDLAPDPDDLFAHTRMSLGDHIEELRGALLRAGKGFFIALILGLFVAYPVLQFIRYPVESQLRKIEESRQKKAEEELKQGTNPKLTEADQPFPIALQLDRKELAKALGLPDSNLDGWANVTAKLKPSEVDGPTRKLRHAIDNPGEQLIALTVTESFVVFVH